jgi:hypothetical protein
VDCPTAVANVSCCAALIVRCFPPSIGCSPAGASSASWPSRAPRGLATIPGLCSGGCSPGSPCPDSAHQASGLVTAIWAAATNLPYRAAKLRIISVAVAVRW